MCLINKRWLVKLQTSSLITRKGLSEHHSALINCYVINYVICDIIHYQIMLDVLQFTSIVYMILLTNRLFSLFCIILQTK